MVSPPPTPLEALRWIADETLPCRRCGKPHPWRCSAGHPPVVQAAHSCVVEGCKAGGTFADERDGHSWQEVGASWLAERVLADVEGVALAAKRLPESASESGSESDT